MIQKEDVENVATVIKQTLDDAEIAEVLDRYPSEQDEDPSATWNLVVENIIHNIVNNRKKPELSEKNLTEFLKKANAKFKAKNEFCKSGADWVSEMNFIFSDKLILRVWFDPKYNPNSEDGDTGFRHRWCNIETL